METNDENHKEQDNGYLNQTRVQIIGSNFLNFIDDKIKAHKLNYLPNWYSFISSYE